MPLVVAPAVVGGGFGLGAGFGADVGGGRALGEAPDPELLPLAFAARCSARGTPRVSSSNFHAFMLRMKRRATLSALGAAFPWCRNCMMGACWSTCARERMRCSDCPSLRGASPRAPLPISVRRSAIAHCHMLVLDSLLRTCLP